MDPFWSHVLVAIPATLLALAAFLTALKNYQGQRELRKEVNGRLTQMLALTAGKGRAEGKQEEREERRERDSLANPPPAADPARPGGST